MARLCDRNKINLIKEKLVGKLNAEHSFWSYSPGAVTCDNISDELLISNTMRYLDLDEIKALFSIFPMRKIKDAWLKHLVPEGERFYTLNRFFAWFYFGVKNPDAYLKSIQTRHLNSLLR